MLPYIIDIYIQKKVGEIIRRNLGAFHTSVLPLSENHDHRPKNRTVDQPGDAFEDTAFVPGFEIFKF